VNILGINAYHGDVSAAIVRDGELVAAVEEERFRRIKHVAGFPQEAIRCCLQMARLGPHDIQEVGVSRSPRAHLWRKVAFALRHRPRQALLRDRAANYRRVSAVPDALSKALNLDSPDRLPRVHWVEHHPAHLASAFFVSPFNEAAVCAVDGFGDFVSTSWGLGQGSRLRVVHRTFFPHSLGLLYLALTQYLGFTRFGDEFKVMGLAPYGCPEFASQVRKLVRLCPDGRVELDLSYFVHWRGDVAMTWDDGEPTIGKVYSEKLERELGPARRPDDPLTPRHEAIAASLQHVFEEAYFHVLNGVHARLKVPALCLAGGCAMNSVANGQIRNRTPFREVFIQPAAGDNGTALGAAYWVSHQLLGHPRSPFTMRHGYWGPEFRNGEVDSALLARRADLQRLGCAVRTLPDDAALVDWTAGRIADGQIVGWFQGRMEWGARALGNRSILADPRREDIRETINSKIKLRERFRPFAPSVLEEAHADYFSGSTPDPFMMQVFPVRPEKRDVIPAVTHVDGSGRLQTVSRDANPLYWRLIRAFERQTGVPVLLNTSFNENEPIVREPIEALDCFLRTGMDVLVLGNHVIAKPTPPLVERS
jgi:carbamoyltransferase